MNFLRITAAVLSLCVLCGCATGAKSQTMVFDGEIPGNFNKSLVKAVSIWMVKGGKDTEGDGTPQISNEAFEEALRESLTAHGLYYEYGGYQLSANMYKVTDPPGDFDMTVTMYVQYTLLDAVRDKVVFKEKVVSEHTAFTEEALTSVTRIRFAKEGAARKNIAEFLLKLSEL